MKKKQALYVVAGLSFLLTFYNKDIVAESSVCSTITPIELNFEDPPINLQGNEAQFARNVAYGPYEENVFDIFLVEATEPTPLIVYIHGGGFTDGDKGVVYLSARDEIREVLSNGASYATINYRLLDEVDKEGVIKPLSDSKRCLQFLRYHHEQLNVDPSRIAIYGASAGAGTCLWMAFSDEMADPAANDPVLRESTRFNVIGAKAAQATYDLLKWETVVFDTLGMTLEDMANLPNSSEQGLLSFFGADSFEQLGTPEFKAYRERVDMLGLMSLDDPPFWVQNNVENAGIPVDLSELFHHGLHALALKERAEEVGLECQAYIPALDIADPAGDGVIKFMLDRIEGEKLYGQYKKMMHDGIMREYAVVEPPLDPNPDGYPLVIGLHGAGSEGYGFISTAFLGQKAAKEKFIVASPSSLRYPLMAWWNAGDGYEAITDSTDDVGFVSALIDTMVKNYNVDTTRIYIMAHSNGSMMAYRVAAECSDRIAAIGVNSGQMVYEYCNPEYPVPIIHFHGLADPICPYEGGANEQVVLPSVDSVMTIWCGINNCDSVPDMIYNENGIIGKKWASADGESDVILYTIEDWGHKWPRQDEPGIVATDVMWDFLKVHKRSINTDVKEKDMLSVAMNFKVYQNYPNPFNPFTTIKYKIDRSDHITLTIYNLAGQKIEILVNEFQTAGEHEIIWQPKGLSSGLYLLQIQAQEISETRKLILQK